MEEGPVVLPRRSLVVLCGPAGAGKSTVAVSAHEEAGLVVLEGHVRLTAYALAFDALPPELEVLVGRSPAIARWSTY